MQAATPSRAHARAARLARALRIDLATTEVFARFEADGLDALLLRGPVIASRLYEPGARAYGDCDILAPDTSRAEIEATLATLGFATYLPRREHWRRATDGAEIDLHESIPGARAANDVLWRTLASHRCTIDVEGTPVAALDPEATAVIVALHAAHHGAVVPHTLVDLERALERFDDGVWRHAVAIARDIDALTAVRQALTMLPAGVERLEALGLDPSVSVRSKLRQRGIVLPYYLTEALTPRERAAVLWHRATPSRTEIAAVFDPRAAHSTPRLLAVHARRVSRLPVSTARLAIAGWQARRHARAR